MNHDLWLSCLQEIKKNYNIRYPGIEPILLIDNASCHCSLETLAWCIENKVHAFFLPPNVTHFLNPLDDKDLAVFKKAINDNFPKSWPYRPETRGPAGRAVASSIAG